MTRAFIERITYSKFLEEAKDTFALQELAKFYENPLETEKDVLMLMDQMKETESHVIAFDFSIYFAAWIKSEVGESKKAFKKFDHKMLEIVKRNNSLQHTVVEMVEAIAYEQFLKHFAQGGLNEVTSFLKKINVFCLEDFHKLDDIEARHILDQIIMYSGLPEMRINCV